MPSLVDPQVGGTLSNRGNSLAQLDYAIEYLIEELAGSGGKWDIPETPPFPDKSRPNMSRNRQ